MQQWLSVPVADLAQSGVPNRILSEAVTLIERFYLHHVAREFRSLRVLKDVGKRAALNRKERSRDRSKTD
jgi:hypothetical protein